VYLLELLKDASLTAVEKREAIAREIESGEIGIRQIERASETLGEKGLAILLESMEAVSLRNPGLAEIGWLRFAGRWIDSASGSVKREASRLVGNLAARFPNDLSPAIEKLLENTSDSGTVVRWASAYALARIVVLPEYAGGDLVQTVTAIAEREQNGGVKNQYLKALKRVKVKSDASSPEV